MDQVGSVEIVIKGGRPWGFTLQGGIESRSALTVAQIEPRGKADRHGALKVGDHVLRINDVQCFSLADATQLIDCAFRTLTVLVWRSKSAVGVPCPQIRDTSRYGGTRYHRPLMDETSVVKRAAAANSTKVLPRRFPKECPSPKSTELPSPNPRVTLICDSHQKVHENQETENLKKYWSSGDRSPLQSSGDQSGLDRSNSALSLASTVDSHEDVFQTHESPNRYSRSPRNLTKDSGYETCAQAEHDYVNVQWINSSVSNRMPLSPPPPPPAVHYLGSKKGPVVKKMPKSPENHFAKYPAKDSYCEQWELERREKSLVDKCHRSKEDNLGLSYCSDCNESGIPSAPVPFNKRTGSFSSLYSSSESLSPRSSKADLTHIRSAKSSVSLRGKLEKPIPVPLQQPTVVPACQYFSKLVSPAQSTPNLHSKEEMMTPSRTNKKSVYEELACKSGFDFSPMVQRQPFWAPKQVFESDSVLGSRSAFTKSRSRKLEDQEPISLPASCDKNRACDNLRNYYANVENVTTPDPFDEDGKMSNTPPPVPTRDSSLRCRGNPPTHEKFPSWPVSVPVETDPENNCQSSGCRSNSWTEQTRCAKDAIGSYSRPETHFQISAQQLPPVQEKNRKGSRKPPNYAKNEHLTDRAMLKFTRESSLSRNETFNVLNHFTFDSIYQNSDKVFYPSEKQYDTHSPPERDVTSPSGNSANKQLESYSYKQVYENAPRPISEACDLYENLRVGANNPTNNSNTPLLDRLRLERENLPVSWSQRQDADTFSDAGTCVSSNSSSQETLKWHGSYSDLVSINELARNESPSFGSDGSTIYEELQPGSTDGSEKSYSTLCSSPLEYLADNCSKNENHWEQFATNPHPPHSLPSSHEVNSVVTKHATYEPPMVAEPKNCAYGSRRNNTFHDILEDRQRSTSLGYPPRVSSDGTRESVFCSKTTGNGSDKSTPNSEGCTRQNPVSQLRETLIKHNISNKSPSQRQSASGFWRNASEKNHPHSWELKAIQKQAVLSFYHRQTAVVSKDAADRKTPRSSSFSYFRDMDKLVPLSVSPTNQCPRKRSLSSSSFSQQISESHPHSTTNPGQNFTSSNGKAHSNASLPTVPIKSHIASERISKRDPATPPGDLHNPVPQNSVDHCESKPGTHREAANFTREADPDSDNNQSDRSLRIPVTARKAYLKQTCKTNENIVVRVLSSQGITLAKGRDETKTCPNYPNVKPKVPPKRIQRDNSLVVPLKHQAPPQSPSDNTEDEELQAIENNAARDGIPAPFCGALIPSPDLPLPPPPTNTETEVLPTDDPFPPPPLDLQEFSLSVSEINQQSYGFTCTRNVKPFNQDVSTAFPCDVPVTCVNVLKPINQHTEVSVEEISPERTDELVPSQDSSPAVFSASYIQSQDAQVRRMENQKENEAVYVNLDFRNREYSNSVAKSAPNCYNIKSAVSVTNSATQTSEATPSLQRRANNFLKKNDRSESPRKCFIYPTECVINQIQSFDSSGYPDNSANELPVHDVKSANDSDCINMFSHTIQRSGTFAPRDEIGLPLTNPYFTTSEPKAKLLTRYCQTWDKQWSDQLELKGQKEELIASISKKLNVLRLEQIELKEEMKQNEELGQEVTAKIEKIAKPNEVQKYRIHVEELEKIINLLLSLSGRLARAESALLILPEDAKTEEKNILEAKRNKLSQQHDEAWYLKENIDRRSSQVSLFLHHYLTREEYADYEHFIKMKSKLLMDAREIDEKIRLGEEQLAALHGTFPATHQNGETDNKLSGERKSLQY